MICKVLFVNRLMLLYLVVTEYFYNVLLLLLDWILLPLELIAITDSVIPLPVQQPMACWGRERQRKVHAENTPSFCEKGNAVQLQHT